MRSNLIRFVTKLHEKEVEFLSCDFVDFDFSVLKRDDFVYCDPPYLITTGTYNDGKRGFKGWSESEEVALFGILDTLDTKGIKFALSNVLKHKNRENTLLKQWVEKQGYYVNFLNKHYANSNYQTKNRDKKSSTEVLITNYKIDLKQSLFDYKY
jgi:DNA adenine methylase